MKHLEVGVRRDLMVTRSVLPDTEGVFQERERVCGIMWACIFVHQR